MQITMTLPFSAEDRDLLLGILGDNRSKTSATINVGNPVSEPTSKTITDAHRVMDAAITTPKMAKTVAEEVTSTPAASLEEAMQRAARAIQAGRQPAVREALKVAGANRVSNLTEANVDKFLASLPEQ